MNTRTQQSAAILVSLLKEARHGIRKFENIEITDTIELKGFDIGSELRFENCSFKKIIIQNSVFQESVNFLKTNVEALFFENIKANKQFNVSTDVPPETVHLKKINFGTACIVTAAKKTTAIIDCEGPININFNPFEEAESVLIAGSQSSDIRMVSDSFFNAFNEKQMQPVWYKIKRLHFRGSNKAKTYIYRCYIKELIFELFTFKETFSIDHVKSDKVVFLDSINTANEKFLINRLSPITVRDSEIHFVSSDLGACQIRSCKLCEYSKFIFYNSEFDRVLSRGTIWPTKVCVEEIRRTGAIRPDFTDESEREELKALYYKSCKTMMANSGERWQEINFRKLELDQRYSRTKWKNFLHKLALGLSKYSSHHGTNWLLSSTLYILLTIAFSLILMYLNCDSFKIDAAFQLLNPAHHFESLKIEGGFLVHLVDTLSRVTNSYLIYQTIRGFRNQVP